jgi:uncharacterized protein YgbK (DUF1537 family)
MRPIQKADLAIGCSANSRPGDGRQLPALRSSGVDRQEIRRRLAEGLPKLVVLDDDPTGTQTIHGVWVLTEWSVPSLVREFRDSRPCVFVLTNTRALPAREAATRCREINANIAAAARSCGCAVTLVSRSDSTLRGHFPLEVELLADGTNGRVDAVVVVPAFIEGGRITIDNIHYVMEGERLVPVAETEFARDATFGYRSSDLRDWIAEKTAGRVRASDVRCISLQTIRVGGAGAIKEALLGTARGSYIVVNATAYEDLEIFVHGMLLAEHAGRRFVFRTAASFVRVRAGIGPHALLTAAELGMTPPTGGLVVVGSYVEKTTAQLAAALELPAVSGIELRVGELAQPDTRQREIARVSGAANSTLTAGITAVIYTSRQLESAIGGRATWRLRPAFQAPLSKLRGKSPGRPASSWRRGESPPAIWPCKLWTYGAPSFWAHSSRAFRSGDSARKAASPVYPTWFFPEMWGRPRH